MHVTGSTAPSARECEFVSMGMCIGMFYVDVFGYVYFLAYVL